MAGTFSRLTFPPMVKVASRLDPSISMMRTYSASSKEHPNWYPHRRTHVRRMPQPTSSPAAITNSSLNWLNCCYLNQRTERIGHQTVGCEHPITVVQQYTDSKIHNRFNQFIFISRIWWTWWFIAIWKSPYLYSK